MQKIVLAHSSGIVEALELSKPPSQSSQHEQQEAADGVTQRTVELVSSLLGGGSGGGLGAKSPKSPSECLKLVPDLPTAANCLPDIKNWSRRNSAISRLGSLPRLAIGG